MSRNARIFNIDSYILSLTIFRHNAFIHDRAIAHSSPQSLIQHVRGSHYVIKQSHHSKIAFLSKVKSETLVLEARRGELKKPDLTLYGEASTRVVDLLMR